MLLILPLSLLENPRLELNGFVLDKTKTAQFKAVSATLSG
jgi:hypothetical protein